MWASDKNLTPKVLRSDFLREVKGYRDRWVNEEVPVKRQRSTAQVRIAYTCEGCGLIRKTRASRCRTAMYVKEEFTYGERRTCADLPAIKYARTRFWTVLVLSDDDGDSESED